MRSQKIYTKLLIAFMAIIALTVILGAVGIILIRMESDMVTEIYDVHLQGIAQVDNVQIDYTNMRVILNRAAVAAVSADPALVISLRSEFDRYSSDIDAAANAYEATTDSTELKAKVAVFRRAKQDYGEEAVRFLDICRSAASSENAGAIASVNAALVDLAAKAAPVESSLEDLVVSIDNYASSANDSSDLLRIIATAVQGTLMGLIVIASLFIAVFIAKGIEKNLESMIKTVSQATLNINSSSAQLNDASESLATGSSRQAAAIEETSATMNETASMVQQNAENTRVAAQLALESQQAVEQSGRYMKELMNTMTELKESSDKVSKIVKTIDDIAFQTNLLAINATVEAARAGGDAGRSFSVVAQEVRSLAQRSAEASSETAEIIQRNITLTGTSRTSAGKVLAITEKDGEQIVKLNKLISEINAASEEQSSGIKQINIAISQMEKVTQENAAVAEENAAASNSMRDEIGNLEEAVNLARSMVRHAD
ncbi:MAG: methyl-accepting chemotaxis protein [Oscillospiraceae bacterium]|nr:methyl-accepting chemotaxis protein [Oscillospiraceae bacterium]